MATLAVRQQSEAVSASSEILLELAQRAESLYCLVPARLQVWLREAVTAESWVLWFAPVVEKRWRDFAFWP